MVTQLTDIEARILGSLSEKSFTTPEQYPLSLNSLVNACNQKTSREPVMNLDETTVARGLASLKDKSLVSPRSEPGSRVTKFTHRIENLLGGGTSKEIAIVTVLLLRGPQTTGEIRIRTDRMATFASVQEVEAILQEMAVRPEPLVVRLPRQSGQKEARYQHLFSGHVAGDNSFKPAPRIVDTPSSPSPSYSSPVSSYSPSYGSTTPAPAPAMTDDQRRSVQMLADLLGNRLMALEQRIAFLEARVSQLENKPTY